MTHECTVTVTRPFTSCLATLLQETTARITGSRQWQLVLHKNSSAEHRAKEQLPACVIQSALQTSNDRAVPPRRLVCLGWGGVLLRGLLLLRLQCQLPLLHLLLGTHPAERAHTGTQQDR